MAGSGDDGQPRVDRTAFSVFDSFEEADAADAAYWRSRTPAERMAHLELLRGTEGRSELESSGSRRRLGTLGQVAQRHGALGEGTGWSTVGLAERFARSRSRSAVRLVTRASLS